MRLISISEALGVVQAEDRAINAHPFSTALADKRAKCMLEKREEDVMEVICF
jgi:hypothetical protein